MHEVGIMQNTLAMAIAKAEASGATRIHQLQLQIGALSGVVPDALQFAFETLRQNTIAAEALLDVEFIPATCWCGACQSEFQSPDLLFECPKCGILASELRRGRELHLKSVEIS